MEAILSLREFYWKKIPKLMMARLQRGRKIMTSEAMGCL
jgi:hypothetical protein